MKKIFIVFLTIFIVSCGKNLEKNTENISENVKTEIKTEIKNEEKISTFKQIEKLKNIEIWFVSSVYYREKGEKWESLSIHPVTEIEKIWLKNSMDLKVSYYNYNFENLAEVKEFFEKNSIERFALAHINFNENISEADALELLSIFSENKLGKKFDDNFLHIWELPEKFSKNEEIVKTQEKLLKKMKDFTISYEIIEEIIYNFDEKSKNFWEKIYDKNDVFTSVSYLLWKTKSDDFDFYRRLEFTNLEDLKYVLTKTEINSEPIWMISIWLFDSASSYLKFLANKEPVYDEKIILEILEAVKNYDNFALELHFFGFKKEYFENEKILEKISEIKAKNIVFHIEHNFSFVLQEKFYKKILEAKTTNTITFDVFWFQEREKTFCYFIAENSEKQKIIYREEKPFLFCLNTYHKLDDIPWNKENKELREKFLEK